MMSWDGQGDLFYMGNNFNRGTENGVSGGTRDNTGDIWVATYAPGNPGDHSTDGSRYVRTVILATNTFGLGMFNDKTDLDRGPGDRECVCGLVGLPRQRLQRDLVQPLDRPRCDLQRPAEDLLAGSAATRVPRS